MDALYGHATEPIPHRVSRVRRPNVARELAGARIERLRSKKKARAGFASNVTVKIREITELLTDDRNLSTVKEKLVHAVIAFTGLRKLTLTIAQKLRMQAVSRNVVTIG